MVWFTYSLNLTHNKKIIGDKIGSVNGLLADTGYYSEANVVLCDDEKITPYISAKREHHHRERCRDSETERNNTSNLQATLRSRF